MEDCPGQVVLPTIRARAGDLARASARKEKAAIPVVGESLGVCHPAVLAHNRALGRRARACERRFQHRVHAERRAMPELGVGGGQESPRPGLSGSKFLLPVSAARASSRQCLL